MICRVESGRWVRCRSVPGYHVPGPHHGAVRHGFGVREPVSVPATITRIVPVEVPLEFATRR